MQSQERAAEAWSGGYFAKSVVPVRDQNGLLILDHDEHMRPGTTMESLAGSSPPSRAWPRWPASTTSRCRSTHWIEKINHVHTGGNSSGIVDGAALVVVGSEKAGKGERPDRAPASSPPPPAAPTRRSCSSAPPRRP